MRTLKFFVTGLLAMAAVAAVAQQKPLIAVVRVNNETSTWHTELGPALENYLAEEFLATGKFRVVERQALEAVLREQALGMSGAIDDKTAAKVGKILGVQMLVIGNVSQLDVKSSSASGAFGVAFSGKSTTIEGTLSVRMVSTTTAELVFAKSYSASEKFGSASVAGFGGGTDFDETKVKKIFTKAVKAAVGDVALKYEEIKGAIGANGPIEGKIASAKADVIMINIGTNSGVKAGDEFDVMRVKDEIIDPDTGKVIGRDEAKVGVITVTSVVNDTLSKAIVTSGKGFVNGDIVRRSKTAAPTS